MVSRSRATFRSAEENEARFRGAIESLQESFALYDADDRLVLYNDEFVRLHASIQDIIKPGLSFEGLIRASVKRGMVTEAIGREEQYIQERVRQHRNPSEMIVRQLTDGTWYIINEARTPDGGIAVTQTDITELKGAEKALREGEERLKAIIDTVPALINVKDTEGRYQLTNRHHNEFFGFEAGDLIGKTSSILSKEHGDMVRELDRTIMETGEAMAAYDYQMTDVKGRKRNLLTTKIPLRDLSNEIIGILSTSVDITDRKQAEEALRESEARTRAIVSNVIDGIITIDEGGMIHTVNPAAERMFGYSERDLIGKNVNFLAAEPHRSAHDRYLANYLTTGEKKIIGKVREFEAERRNGKRFPIELAVREVRLGDERMFVGIIRDITQRKEMERLKGEFVSTVSHELRTPLTSIRGSLGLITGGAVGKLSGKVREMIDVAEKNTERLINLVNDILDMEKIESGSMEFRFGPLDLARLVEQGIETNKGYAEDQGVEFLLTETQAELTVRGDGDRLMQVMANLLSNAAKFSPKGEKIEIAVTRHNNRARVSVSDHGPGIPKEFQDQVFSKFTQADS
ncbi:MAG: PAS domain S-box protein, partial [Proteobacteria bacterium]|nr:PAS domain S-box protein [Pseudomonadota bacterium]